MEVIDYGWNNNEKYKNNKHIQVQEIKRDAEQSIIFTFVTFFKKSWFRRILFKILLQFVVNCSILMSKSFCLATKYKATCEK